MNINAEFDRLVAPLELDLQELEPLEAPGFWSGFKQSFAASAAVVSLAVASATVATAISALT